MKELIPKRRFEGFTDPWEQRKLEVARFMMEPPNTKIYRLGVKFVSVENIGTLYYFTISQVAYDKEYSNKQAEKGDVFMTRIGDIEQIKLQKQTNL